MKNQFIALLFLGACAQLHHVQVSDVDAPRGKSYKKVDLKVSETGVDLQDVQGLTKIFTDKKGDQKVDDAFAIIGLFQMGPRTGVPVFVENYTEKLPEMLRRECPSGQLRNIVSIRETRKYPVISGEIVKISADCLHM